MKRTSMVFTLFVVSLVTILYSGQAKEELTLEQCINLALKQNPHRVKNPFCLP